MLVPAFGRALRDPFVHARVAGLMSFMATIDCFDPQEIATKVLPSVVGALVDQEKYCLSYTLIQMAQSEHQTRARSSIQGCRVVCEES